jgi:hypothetical protein
MSCRGGCAIIPPQHICRSSFVLTTMNASFTNNEYIAWDHDCQMEMAQKYAIPIFDLYKYLGMHTMKGHVIMKVLLQVFGDQKK